MSLTHQRSSADISVRTSPAKGDIYPIQGHIFFKKLDFWRDISVYGEVHGRVLEADRGGIHVTRQAWLGICLYVPGIRMMSIVQPGNQMGQRCSLNA